MIDRCLVRSLLQVRAPKVLVALVLLLSFNTKLSFDDPGKNFHFTEVFSGQGAVSKRMHELGCRTASLDLEYSEPHMNFLKPTGFLLVLYTVLNQDRHGLTLWAPVCSSWGLPARSTSQRSYVNPMGGSYNFVEDGNCMVSRMVLCILLILSRNAYYLVEQPAQSLLYMHKRWQFLANRVSWVYQTFFWMQLHGSSSPKRTVVMGNLRTLGTLDKGRLTAKERVKRTKIRTTRKYLDKGGRFRFAGRKAALRSTQAYPSGLGDAIHAAYLEQLKGPPHGDLRVERTPNKTKGPVELFQEMELGDCWSDANLKECFDYLYNCRHTRIPSEWQEAMEQFAHDWAAVEG